MKAKQNGIARTSNGEPEHKHETKELGADLKQDRKKLKYHTSILEKPSKETRRKEKHNSSGNKVWLNGKTRSIRIRKGKTQPRRPVKNQRNNANCKRTETVSNIQTPITILKQTKCPLWWAGFCKRLIRLLKKCLKDREPLISNYRQCKLATWNFRPPGRVL